MITPMYYGHVLGGEDGRTPVPVQDFVVIAESLGNYEARQVAYTTDVVPGVNVSTVFIPVMSMEGIHFETMVQGGPLHGPQARYATWEQAAEGHERICTLVRDWEQEANR